MNTGSPPTRCHLWNGVWMGLSTNNKSFSQVKSFPMKGESVERTRKWRGKVQKLCSEISDFWQSRLDLILEVFHGHRREVEELISQIERDRLCRVRSVFNIEKDLLDLVQDLKRDRIFMWPIQNRGKFASCSPLLGRSRRVSFRCAFRKSFGAE